MVKIAIVEDDAAISQMYRMKFESEGYLVRIANDGNEGVDLVRTFLPDVILLDLKMPTVDGLTALQEIRSNDWGVHIPVIILTNLGSDESPHELASLNVDNYIVKADLTPRQVVARVKELLATKTTSLQQ